MQVVGIGERLGRWVGGFHALPRNLTVELHDGGLVAAPVAVVGGAEEREHAVGVLPLQGWKRGRGGSVYTQNITKESIAQARPSRTRGPVADATQRRRRSGRELGATSRGRAGAASARPPASHPRVGGGVGRGQGLVTA